MKMTNLKKSLSFFLCIVLIAVMALLTTGCNGNKETPDENPSEISSQENASTDNEAESKTDEKTDGVITVGTGKTQFAFTVTHADGTTKAYNVLTDKTTVGEALLDAQIIAGEDGQYGLYVKTVDGETLDYDTDGKYWAFYVNGEYGMTGVDMTDITEGTAYEFRAE